MLATILFIISFLPISYQTGLHKDMDIQNYILPLVSFRCDICSFTVTCTWRTYVEVLFVTGRLGGICSELGRRKQRQNEKNCIMGSFITHRSPACKDQKLFFFAWLTTVWLHKKELHPAQNPKVHCHRQKGSTLFRVLTHSNPVYTVTTHLFIHVDNAIKKVWILLITEDFLRTWTEGENFRDLHTDYKNFKIRVVQTKNVGLKETGLP